MSPLEAARVAADPGHPLDIDALDLSHNVILYLDNITVSFDGFKALNKL